MRLHINLASQPYEAARHYRQRITAVIAGLGLAAVVLVAYIVYQRAHTRGINRQLSEVQQQIDGMNREESQARAILNRPANRVVADQSEFLNELFARKALSWTRVFMVMEKIMPADLHVVSMKPDYTKSNDLMLHVIVATDSRDRAVELVRHMEKSSHFRQAQVVAETVVTNTSDQTAGGGAIQFDIAAIYIPNAADNDLAPENKSDDKAGTPAKTASASAGTPSPALRGSSAAVNAAQNRPAAGSMREH